MFSGRGGPTMSCLEEKGTLWVFDPAMSDWSTISPMDPELPYPLARSYHALASDGNETIYLHAGCPAQGRLSDLWSFHLPTHRWKELEPAPGPPRGGSSTTFSGEQLYRMNGFDGTTEQGGNVDIYDINAGTWSSFPFTPDGNAGPEPRSVSCLLAVDIHGNSSLVAMFGEQDPSSLGHEGAGKMLGDVWVFDIKSETWKQVRAHPGEEEPAARGWLGADVVRDSTKAAIVVHGGLNESNQRLGDVWLLEI
jgi:N-acetylneuraminic acid mutarotase